MKRALNRAHKNPPPSDITPAVSVRDLSWNRWILRTIASGIIFSILLFIIVNFYVFASLVSLDSFLIVFLLISVLIDGLYLLVHLFRRPVRHPNISFDASKLSVVIACYNGEDVIGETITQLLRHVAAENIVVVSDASSDQTAVIAKRMGARVLVNPKNLNKAFSVSVGVHAVTTPYVLLLDDDVLVGDICIPTSLLDDGYSAVAFNVMPIKTDTFANAIQQFEYRNSMHVGKSLRAGANAVGNVSGAIGLYHTDDLKEQAYLHTGQFAGEDEQRTILTHIYGRGKGVTFSDQVVTTHVPNTFHALYRQRSYGWNLTVPELLTLYLRILFSPRYNYLLKAEKAYYTYIYLTDPLRMLFLWAVVLRPRYLAVTYGVYLAMSVLVWFKTKCKDQFLVVLVYPFYTLWLSCCRFIGNFYWFKVKLVYFRKKHHRFVERRNVVTEFAAVTVLFGLAWAVSTSHFVSDMRLFHKIRSSRLVEQSQVFHYDTDTTGKTANIDDLGLRFSQEMPLSGTYITVVIEKGDTMRAIAHKVVDRYAEAHPEHRITYAQRAAIDHQVAGAILEQSVYYNTNNSSLFIPEAAIQGVIQ